MTVAAPPQTSTTTSAERPSVRGKFLYRGDAKLFLKGVTYGPFKPEDTGPHAGSEYHTPEQVESDFSQMAAHGYNAVRCYTVPPRWLLDVAQQHGLLVMIGLPWEQHITFLNDAKRRRDIEQRVRQGVSACKGHAAVLCYAVGNEIPAPIVRWYGPRPIERFLKRLCDLVRAEDPGCLVTYVNFPSTEYLNLPFLDIAAFNVYLESREKLDVYLAKLQTHAGDRPLLMAEVGLDSQRNGEQKQADTLTWQIQTVFAAGAIGLFIFSWTDEWYRGGAEILDWAFGLVTRERQPKLALDVVSRAFDSALPANLPPPVLRGRAGEGVAAEAGIWPKITVAVCTHNRAAQLKECLDHLSKLTYPNVEILLIDDGSTDSTPALATQYPQIRTIRTEHTGLSAARNAALTAATGDIIAYIDDDAFPDPDWLTYLVQTWSTAQQRGDFYAALGGPNLAPLSDGPIADCVNQAPGGPTHVLITDRDAEHLPGCNMAFLTDALREIGGFDPRFRIAGDDVDVCWRLHERGHRLGFAPAAVVWHHRRASVRDYWRQQFQYGRAEAQLQHKWPAKYDAAGRAKWAGHVYGGTPQSLGRRIFFGVWGSAPFQSIYHLYPTAAWSIALRPEWYLLIAGLFVAGFFGVAWHWLFLAWAVMGAMVLSTIGSALAYGWHAELHPPTLQKRLIVSLLHLLQPVARLSGRMTHGVGPWNAWWRLAGVRGWDGPLPLKLESWSETWRAPEERVGDLEEQLLPTGAPIARGGEYDRWDLQISGGPLAGARTLLTIEEHGAGKQMTRLRIWPRIGIGAAVWLLALLIATLAAFTHHRMGIAITLLILLMLFSFRALRECTAAMATARRAFFAANGGKHA